MSRQSNAAAEAFIEISDQFRLGALTTESSHPVTANLSATAKDSVEDALGLLFEVDTDVVGTYREWAASGNPQSITQAALASIESGGRIFFTGCGATGRLSIQLASIWRDFWQKNRELPKAVEMEDRAVSVMAGGDFALIKSVEGFEDYTAFGRKQIEDLGVSAGDVVFAITEGGETSFVIGTAWKALEKGAKVYFIYNNPDEALREHVERSREVIDDPRIEKINLTTGPMAITGSTRMQATSIQLCAMLTVLEMVVRELQVWDYPRVSPPGSHRRPVSGLCRGRGPRTPGSGAVPSEFLAKLEEMHSTLISQPLRAQLARLVDLEESVCRSGRKVNYFADELGIDILTDTTERSPTFCTPPFRRFDDTSAAQSWAFLFLPCGDTPAAWKRILKREPGTIDWTLEQVSEMVGEEKAGRQYEIVRGVSREELVRFRIGLDGIPYRPAVAGDGVVGAALAGEKILGNGFLRSQLEAAREAGAAAGLICFGEPESLDEVKSAIDAWGIGCRAVLVPAPRTDFLLNGVTRVGVKMLLNALSTCVMVRLGRVIGNYMIWVVASNLKLIDRAARYIQELTGLSYNDACYLLFEVIEYVEPRMRSDQAYPPVVGVAVMRAKYGIGNEEAEKRLGNDME